METTNPYAVPPQTQSWAAARALGSYLSYCFATVWMSDCYHRPSVLSLCNALIFLRLSSLVASFAQATDRSVSRRNNSSRTPYRPSRIRPVSTNRWPGRLRPQCSSHWLKRRAVAQWRSPRPRCLTTARGRRPSPRPPYFRTVSRPRPRASAPPAQTHRQALMPTTTPPVHLRSRLKTMTKCPRMTITTCPGPRSPWLWATIFSRGTWSWVWQWHFSTELGGCRVGDGEGRGC